jgi:hypothetical protein
VAVRVKRTAVQTENCRYRIWEVVAGVAGDISADMFMLLEFLAIPRQRPKLTR